MKDELDDIVNELLPQIERELKQVTADPDNAQCTAISGLTELLRRRCTHCAIAKRLQSEGVNIIYIAGTMKGVKLWNFPAFDAAELFLLRLGFRVTNPAITARNEGMDPTELPDDYDWNDMPGDRDKIIARDLADVRAADGIYMLPGWGSNVGAQAEHAVALWAGKRILAANTVAETKGDEDDSE